MHKVFITGIDGFTGKYLAHELMRIGCQVSGTIRSAGACAASSWVEHVCDLRDGEALEQILATERPDAIVHLAAISFVKHDDVADIYETNVIGTRNLMKAITASGCKPEAVLLASSANVYGNVERDFVDENAALSPMNDYAVSKLAMEYVGKLWRELPIIIVRPFNYTGVGQSANFLLPKLVSGFRARTPEIELGNLNVVRDFSDVRTVVSIYRALLNRKYAGKILNICSGVGYSLEDILGMMERITGHHPAIRVNQKFIRENEVRRLVGSRSALDAAVGEFPSIPIDETLRWMLEA